MSILLAVFLGLASPAAAALFAAAGKADVTPDPSAEAVWLAGYGAKGRRAAGIHDRLHARAVLISDGKATVALVAVDAIGLYREDILDMRRQLGWEGADKYLFVSATHDHSAPDTLGLWGRFPGMWGVNAKQHKRLKATVVGLVKELSGRLREAELVAAKAEPDPAGLCRDSRDPVVIDPELDVLELRAKGGGSLATVVRYSCHSEVLAKDNDRITADFPGALCAKLEAERGGTCAFFPGSVGGLMTPDSDDSGPLDDDYKEMERVGHALAAHATKALAAPRIRVKDAKVTVTSRLVKVPVENSRYLFFLRSLRFGHRLFANDGRELSGWEAFYLPWRHFFLFPLPERLRPWVETEVSLVKLGPIKILGIPGELFPELAVGGYDGSRRYGRPLVQPTNPNPPKLDLAPKGPYLREQMKADVGIIVGLANDELGYIMPGYDFQTAGTRTMLPKPPGTHYEETNSIGPRATDIILNAAAELLAE